MSVDVEAIVAHVDRVDELSDELAVLDRKHADALNAWEQLNGTKVGGPPAKGHQLFATIYSLGAQRARLAKAIGEVLDPEWGDE